MEPELGKWIIEFLARQPIPDRTLNNLVAKLPLPVDDYELKKTLLIRSIQSEFLNGVISEKIMYLMELMVELDFREGKIASELLKKAYCAVAVDCTVRFLEEDLEEGGEYFEVLRRIWRVRVPVMESSENRRLVSEGLMKWKDDLEGAVCDGEVRGKVLSRNTRNEALRAVEGYVVEAWEEMGPCLIERCARDVIEMGSVGEGVGGVEVSKSVEDVRLSEIVGNAVFRDVSMVASKGSGADGDGDRVKLGDLREESIIMTSENRVLEVVEKALVVNDGMICGGRSAVDGENSKEKDRIENDSVVEVPQRGKHLSETRGIAAMPISETKIVNNPVGNQDGKLVKLGGEQSFLPHGTSGVRSETGKGAQVRYKHSALRSRVKGYRPGAAKLADVEEMDEHTPEVSQEQEGFGSGSKQHRPDTTLCLERAKSTGVEAQLQAVVESMARGKRKVQPVSAPTNNGDDICTKDSTGQQSAGRDDVNPSANRREDFGEASPGASVNKPRPQSPKMKKKRRFWTSLEEDTLRTGVQKFGKGSWKLILNAYSDAFQGRTEVDLKDKWRNMMK